MSFNWVDEFFKAIANFLGAIATIPARLVGMLEYYSFNFGSMMVWALILWVVAKMFKLNVKVSK